MQQGSSCSTLDRTEPRDMRYRVEYWKGELARRFGRTVIGIAVGSTSRKPSGIFIFFVPQPISISPNYTPMAR